jgi:hypothetical protein
MDAVSAIRNKQAGPMLCALGAKIPWIKLGVLDERRVAELIEELKTILDTYPRDN